VEPVWVVVGDPGAWGHGQDGLTTLHTHTEQLHGPGTDVPGSGNKNIKSVLTEPNYFDRIRFQPLKINRMRIWI
jgi:hypothetical protein